MLVTGINEIQKSGKGDIKMPAMIFVTSIMTHILASFAVQKGVSPIIRKKRYVQHYVLMHTKMVRNIFSLLLRMQFFLFLLQISLWATRLVTHRDVYILSGIHLIICRICIIVGHNSAQH